MKSRRVVITGMGAITPIGNNADEFWKNLVSGKSGAAPITKFDTTNFKTKFGCEIKNYDPLQHFDKKEARKMDLFTHYAMIAAEEAIQHARVDFEKLDRERIGVIWGSGNGGYQTFQEEIAEYAKGDGSPRFSPFFIPKIIVDMAAGMISIKYGLHGINFATVAACATSNVAIIDAFNYIRWNKADMFITGGSEASITESSLGGFSASKALSTNNENPEGASRPFDVDRDGFVMGEGGGALVLESLEHAQKRNAPILAEIIGGGMAADAYHMTGTHPEGYGAYLSMKLALEDCEGEVVKPEDIDYINAHATSTQMGDISELKAIERLFGRNPELNISATKSMTGHLLGAAGAVEAIACVNAIRFGKIPPTINTSQTGPEFENAFDLTLAMAQEKKVNYALSNTFGFGGHTTSVLFGRYNQ